MNKLHITQDSHGYWMLSLEKDDGTLSLLAHQFPTPDHLIENANEMVAEGHVKAIVVVDPPRQQLPAISDVEAPSYQRPAPRKAGA